MVGLTARTTTKLESVADEIDEAGGESLVLPTDVRHREQVESTISGNRGHLRRAGYPREQRGGLSLGREGIVEGELEGWGGQRMPLSRSWVDDAIDDGLEGDRDVARLALLVCKAPYQVGDEVVTPVLERKAEEDLVRVLAWSGMTATRRVTEQAAERYA